MNESDLELEHPSEETTPGDDIPPLNRKEERRPPKLSAHTTPALTIHIQSWSTPIVGFLMLVVGLLSGYFGRPLLNAEVFPTLTPLPTPTEVALTATSPSGNNSSPATLPPVPEDQAARQQQLMDLVLSRTRHFQGNEKATVTLIEFSDFQ